MQVIRILVAAFAGYRLVEAAERWQATIQVLGLRSTAEGIARMWRIRSRIVDLDRAESFGFLGFDFRRLRSIGRQVWRAHYTPKMKKRTALLRKLKDVFRRFQSQPVNRVIQLINPILRGWVNYFALGHSSECFSFIRDWVEKKIRRHMGRSRNRRGFGWKRWSRSCLYDELKLFNGYQVRRLSAPKALPVG